jgi:hypothetical protein
VSAAGFERDTVVDAAGPERMEFSELVSSMRAILETRAPIVHVPPSLMALAARVLGLAVRDVVLTPEEIKGLMAGLLVSHDPPLGEIAFSDWLSQHRSSVGRSYANELDRHFAVSVA